MQRANDEGEAVCRAVLLGRGARGQSQLGPERVLAGIFDASHVHTGQCQAHASDSTSSELWSLGGDASLR